MAVIAQTRAELDSFLDDEKWWSSHSGNPVTKYKGAFVTIFWNRREGGYAYSLQRQPQMKRPIYSRYTYSDERTAKIAAFKHISFLWSDDAVE
jgi:hypothetical protein